jgi:hypothetical protein
MSILKGEECIGVEESLAWSSYPAGPRMSVLSFLLAQAYLVIFSVRKKVVAIVDSSAVTW